MNFYEFDDDSNPVRDVITGSVAEVDRLSPPPVRVENDDISSDQE